MRKYKFLGLKVQKRFVNKIKTDDDQYVTDIVQEVTDYIICLEDIQKNYFELILTEIYGEMTIFENDGMYAEREFQIVDQFGKIDFNPKRIEFINYDYNLDDYDCKYFSYSYNGGSNRYPDGYVIINHEQFIK